MRSFYSFYFDATRIAFQSIVAHKLRAFLTLIGIIIGVASVVLVGASINGLNSYVVDAVSRVLGSNHFMIGRMVHHGSQTEEEWLKRDKRNKKIYWQDYEWLQRQCADCEAVGAEVDFRKDLKQDGLELFGTQISGVTANIADIEDKTISEGRFIAPIDVYHAEFVCVIGNDIKEKFFYGLDPIGRTLKVDEIPMRIIGVEAKRGSMFGQSFDNVIYIPLTTAERLNGRRQSLQLHGKAREHKVFLQTIDEAQNAMRIRHKLKSNEEDDFGVVNTEEVNDDVNQFTGAIAAVVIPITFISLLVGGIVVMNIMLVSVTERTFEIGLRKALGATKRQILLQFLIESSLLSSFGGVIGLLLAAGLAWLIRSTTPIPMTITILYVIMSVAFSGGIGILAGLYPAYKAARLDPIVALGKT